jgi:hypothetical protein
MRVRIGRKRCELRMTLSRAIRFFLLNDQVQRSVAIELEWLQHIQFKWRFDSCKGSPTVIWTFPSVPRAWRRRLNHRGLLEGNGAMADWASPIARVKGTWPPVAIERRSALNSRPTYSSVLFASGTQTTKRQHRADEHTDSRGREPKGLAPKLARHLAVHPRLQKARRELGVRSRALEPHFSWVPCQVADFARRPERHAAKGWDTPDILQDAPSREDQIHEGGQPVDPDFLRHRTRQVESRARGTTECSGTPSTPD